MMMMMPTRSIDNNNNNDDNRPSVSGQEQGVRDDSEHNYQQQPQQPTMETSMTTTILPSTTDDVCPVMSHITNTLDSNDTHSTTDMVSEETKSNLSPEEVGTLPMDSELSQQYEPEPPLPSADNEAKDNGDNDADMLTKNASTNITVSSVLPSDPMVTDSSSSVTATTITNHGPPTEDALYVNHGLAAWERNRQRWLRPRPHTESVTAEKGEEEVLNDDRQQQQSTNTQSRHAKQINVDEIIDAIFTSHKTMLLSTNNQSNKSTNDNSDTTNITSSNMTAPFPQSVPLPQLIDILQDLWEAESL
jgi:hypothetical protein